MTQTIPGTSPATDADLEALRDQLGRLPRGVVGIAARCACGRPTVVVTAPRLEDSSPFPTTFYLTHPRAVKACSTLEAERLMDEYNRALCEDQALAEAYARAHEDYLARRGLLGEVPEIAGVSALAAGGGVNPIGDMALAEMARRGLWSPARCSC